jgi:hypothetical protein
MGLIIKPPSWGYCDHNISSTPSASFGTTVASGAGAEGTAASLIAALTYDVEFLVVQLFQYTTSANARPTTVDILYDPTGGTSYTVLIADILAGQTASTSTATWGGATYMFPVRIPAGSQVAARAHGAAAVSGRVAIHAYGQNANPGSWWAGQRVTSIGVSGSDGTSHTPGDSGAYSSWTNFGSTLSEDCGALVFAIGSDNATQSALTYLFEFGVGGQRIGPPIWVATNTVEVMTVAPTEPIFRSLPAGTQLQVRASCSGTAQVMRVAAYAVH